MHTKHPTLSCITCDQCEPESKPITIPVILGLTMKQFPDLMCLEGNGEFKALSRQGTVRKCIIGPVITAPSTTNSWLKRNVINLFKQVVFYLYAYVTNRNQIILATTRSGVDGTFTALTQCHAKKAKYPTQLWIM